VSIQSLVLPTDKTTHKLGLDGSIIGL